MFNTNKLFKIKWFHPQRTCLKTSPSILTNKEQKKTSSIKKILFCIDSLGCGGAERALIEILKRLDYRQFNVVLYVLNDRGVYFDDIPSQVKWFTNSSLEQFENLYYERYDVEIAFLEGAAVKHIAERDTPAIKIAWIHTNMNNFNWPRQFYRTDKEEVDSFASMDHLVFVSHFCLNGFIKKFPSIKNNKTVIYNLIDSAKIIKKSQEMFLSTTKFTICCIGRFCKEKGYELLLNTISRLLLDNIDFQVWILGEGELQKPLEEKINQLNLKKNVFLKGFIKNPYPYLAQADLFVSTSLVEGAPLVICEALSLGIPVLATQSGGADEILEQGKYGMLVPIEENAVYEGLKSIIRNHAVYEELKLKSRKGMKYFDVNKTMTSISFFLKTV